MPSTLNNLIDPPLNWRWYCYTGQRLDAITGDYYLRARQYDPGTGRFLSRDTWPLDYQNPVELNRYVYTAANPIMYADPSGYFLVGYAKQVFNSVVRVGRSLVVARGQFAVGALSGTGGYLAGVLFVSAIDSLSTGEPIGGLFKGLLSLHDLAANAILGGFAGVASFNAREDLLQRVRDTNILTREDIFKLRQEIFTIAAVLTFEVNAILALFGGQKDDLGEDIVEYITDVTIGVISAVAFGTVNVAGNQILIDKDNFGAVFTRVADSFDDIPGITDKGSFFGIAPEIFAGSAVNTVITFADRLIGPN